MAEKSPFAWGVGATCGVVAGICLVLALIGGCIVVIGAAAIPSLKRARTEGEARPAAESPPSATPETVPAGN